MASVGEGDCHKDPNFAVVCSFLDKYGASLGLEPISYSDLQTYLEDTTGDVSRVLIDIHVRLLKRIGKSMVNSDRFEKCIIKFCHNFSEFDAWEVESYGYKHAQLATKLRILKNLLECQFDYNLKFKEKVNGESAEEMRLLPIGRDKEGQAYWYFLDHDMNLLVYKEEQDDEVADTWKLVCSNRKELADLVSNLQKGSCKEEEEDKTSTCGSKSSKEGSPEKDVGAEKKVAQDLAVEVKDEKTENQKIENDMKGKQTVKGDGETIIGEKKKEISIEQFEIVKKEYGVHEEVGAEKRSQEQVVDIIRVKRTNKKPSEAMKKEKTGRESVALKGKTVEIQLIDIMKDHKSSHEEMDAEGERGLKEPAVPVVKTENTLNVDETANEDIRNENSDMLAVGVEAEPEGSIPLLDSGQERFEPEVETLQQISKDTNSAAQQINNDTNSATEQKSNDINSATEQKSNDTNSGTEQNITDNNDATVKIRKGTNSAAEEISNDTGSAAEEISNDTNSAKEQTSNDINSAKEQTSNDTNSAKEQTSNDTNSEKEQSSNDTNSAKEQTSNDTNSTAEKIDKDKNSAAEEISNDTNSAAEEISNDAKSAAEEISNDAKSAAEEISNDANSATEKKSNDTAKKISEDTNIADKEISKDTNNAAEQISNDTDDAVEQICNNTGSAAEPSSNDNNSATQQISNDTNSATEKISNDTNNETEKISKYANSAATDECQDSKEKPEHSGHVEFNNSVLSSGEKSAELECPASGHDDEEPEDDAGGVHKTHVSEESIDKIEMDHSLQATKSPDLEDSALSEKTSSCEKPKTPVLSETCPEEKSIEIQERNPHVTEQDPLEKADVTSDISANLTEEIPTSAVDLEQAKMKSQSNMDKESSQGASKNVEGSSDEAPKESPCFTEDNISTEKTTPVLSDQLNVQTAEKLTSSGGSSTEGNNVTDSSTGCILSSSVEPEIATDSIQDTGGKSVSEPKGQQLDCETLEVATKGELNDGAVDLCTTAKEVLDNTRPATFTVEVDTDTVHPDSRDNSVSSKDLSCSSDLLHKHKESEIAEQNKSSLEHLPHLACPLDQADLKSCRDSSSSVNEKSMIEIASEGPSSGASLSSPECLSVSADNKKMKSNKHEKSHSIHSTPPAHADSEAQQNINVDKSDEIITDQPDNSVEVKGQKKPERSEIKSPKDPETPVEIKSQKKSENSEEIKFPKGPDNSADLKSQKVPENSEEIKCQKEPDNSEIKSQKEPDNSEIKSQKEPDNSEIKSQKEPDNSEIKSQKEPDNSEIKSQKEHDNSEIKSQKVPDNSEEFMCQKEHDNCEELMCQKEHEQENSGLNKPDGTVEKELTETSCENLVNVDNNKEDGCVEPINKTIKDIKTSRRKRKVGKNSKKSLKMVNGHVDSAPTLNQASEKSVDAATNENEDCVKCDGSNVEDSLSSRPKRSVVSKTGKSAPKNKKSSVKDDTSTKCVNSVVNDTSLNSENATSKNALTNETFINSENSIADDLPANTLSRRSKLKRAVPEPASDEAVDSEPNGKRAKQATRSQKTRAGRNAAARGRSARMATKDSESDDSDIPLSQVRGRGQGMVIGAGGRRPRGRACQRQTQPNQESALDEEAEEGNTSKLGKKKKPDSSTEALSEEDATPAKKGRNQTQSAAPASSKNSSKKKGSVGKKPAVKTTPAAVADDDPSGIRRSLRVRQQRSRRPPTPSSESEASEETSEDGLSSEEEEEDQPDKDFLDSSFTPEEDSGDEEFKPKGRNFQRQAARTSKEEAEEVVNDDTPCVKCGKYDHPEMILLCDKCDAGYHTACLRPPLMLIPDGDWFCPPCEHAKLVEKLLECLQSFDVTIKKKVRLNKRQERLAFVGISISNILHGPARYSGQIRKGHQGDGSHREDKVEGEEAENHDDDSASTSSYESKPEPKRMYRSERLAIRQAQKRSRKEKHRHSHNRQKRSPELEVLSQRTCRTRAAVSYQFKEFDELINNAIEDDKPFRREKPPGISRGKDMSNILGASDEEDAKIRQRDGDSSEPAPPLLKKKTKRRLTRLDSDEDPDDDEEESDEFKLSEEEDSDATEVEEDAEDDESGNSDSGDWKPKRTWYNSHTSSRSSGRRMHNFVVDDDYNSDENAAKRRSTRNSNRGRIHYSDWDSNEETEAEASGSDNSSEGSLYGRKKSQKQKATRMKKKGTTGRKQKGSHDSDSSITIRRKNLRRLIKKRRKDESESEESEKEAKNVKEIPKKAGKSDSEGSRNVNEEESHEDSDESPRFKKKNVLRSSDEDEKEHDVTDVPPMMEAEVCSKIEGTAEVETFPAAAVVEEEKEEEPTVATKLDNAVKIRAGVAVKTKPDSTKKMSDVAVKTKPKAIAKGKKRSDWCEEDKVAVPVTDVAVPGKVRRVSTSDREPESVVDAVPLMPAEVSKPASENKPQIVATESKVNEKVQDVGMSSVDQKTAVTETEGSFHEPSFIMEKSTGSGKKRTVPNFLDVNSGEESDEQKQDLPKDKVVTPSLCADAADTQTTTAVSQISSDGPKARIDHVEGPQHHINFSHPGQHYPFGTGPYSNSAAHGTPYAHHQVTGLTQGLGQMGHESGPPPQNANMLNAAPQSGPPGLIRGFSDSMPHPPGAEAGSAVSQGVRAPHSYTPRGPRPNLGHSFPPGARHSSQGVEPGQIAPKLHEEHRLPHPGFQGGPVGHYPPPGPSGGHMRPGQPQSHRGMQPQFYMGQQQHSRPGMDNDSNPNMGGYMPQNYGARRMPPAHFGQDLSANAVRNPYYGMQTSPPHNMGQHFPRQYQAGMGPGPHNMSSPLTSMGQMARKLGPGSDMHSPSSTQTGGSGEGHKERRSSLGSPPNPEAVHRQEKLIEIRDIKTENNDDDISGKKVGKTGKKRAVSSKSKKKASEPDIESHDIGQPGQHGPAPAASHGHMAAPPEGPDRLSGSGQQMVNYRVGSQPYHMPPYQMPYPHGSNVNTHQMTQGPYMNPRHTPPAAAHQRPKGDGNNASVKSGEGKWNRAENMESHCTTLPNRSPVHMSSYHQTFTKSQPSEQTVSSQERRHSLSPGSQALDATSSDRMKDPASVDQMSIRKHATVDIKPHIQGLPQTTHPTEASPDFGGPPAGQTLIPTTQDYRLHASAHGQNIPQYSQGGGLNTSEAPRAYYSPSSYYPRGPDPRKPMPPGNTWNPDVQGYGGLRYGPPVHPYGMNPNAGNRMPTIKSEFGSHSHPNSDLAGVSEKGSAQDAGTKNDPVNMSKMGDQPRPVLQRSTSSELHVGRTTESGQAHQKECGTRYKTKYQTYRFWAKRGRECALIRTTETTGVFVRICFIFALIIHFHITICANKDGIPYV
ncbi:unnamed protein product [Candidula unifasciata]|uniref:Remodeling and spacing factor 1 n=1 Tax=Candidula unifasciata TaxID=100452 RepID=A0A8S4A5R7_9EUPU|nr:unnamed protein product [Candidula unifasciata]